MSNGTTAAPFTAADVECAFDLLMDSAKEKLRINPRKSWYASVAKVATNADYEVTLYLKRPPPSFLALLATGWSPISSHCRGDRWSLNAATG